MARTARDKIYEAIANDYKRKRHWSKTGPTTVVAGSYHWFQSGNQPSAGTYPGSNLAVQTITGGTTPSVTGGILPFTDPTSPSKLFLTYGQASGRTTNAFGLLKIVDILLSIKVDANGTGGATTGGAGAGGTDITRYTTGDGVFMFFDTTVALGATPSNITVTYTNQAGTSGRTNTALALVTSAIQGRIAHAQYFIPLQAGDTGIRSVQNIALSAGMGAGSAGALVLAKELAEISIDSISSTDHLFGEARWVSDPLRFERIQTGAALSFLWIPGAAVTTPTFLGTLEAVEVDLTS